MIWILLTLIISILTLYAGYKVNSKLPLGLRVYNPVVIDHTMTIIIFSCIPVVNIIMLFRIIILSITTIYSNNYDNKKHS